MLNYKCKQGGQGKIENMQYSRLNGALYIQYCVCILSFSSIIYWENHHFPIELSFQNILTIYVRAYLGALYSISSIYVSVVMPVPYCFDYYSTALSFEIWKCKFCNLVLQLEEKGFATMGKGNATMAPCLCVWTFMIISSNQWLQYTSLIFEG